MYWNLVWTLVILAIVGIAITAFVLALISKSDVKNLKGQVINYSALPQGSTTLLLGPTDSIANASSIPPNDTDVPGDVLKINVPLTGSYWNFSNTHLGTLGKVYIPLNIISAEELYWTVYYSKNGGTQKPLVGALDYTNDLIAVVSLDGITKDDTFTTGDTLELYVKALANPGADVFVTQIPINSAMVFGPINV